MDADGTYRGHQQIRTTANNLVATVAAIPGGYKHLTLEQGNMAFWVANQLRGYVDELIVCDPRKNWLITRSGNTTDALDTFRVCRLLRLGELTSVWQPKRMGTRRLFYHQVKEYQRVTKTLVSHTRQLQASLRHWGINQTLDKRD